MNNHLSADWPAPNKIKAFATTRLGGFSDGPYESLNLAYHVGDEIDKVKANRSQIRQNLNLPNEPFWLEQIHSNKVVCVEETSPNPNADASYTRHSNTVCVVMTADCLPILVCDKNATMVAAIHAGWRSLADGIIEATIKAMAIDHQQLLIWFGPAISAKHFEVGEDVRKRFLEHHDEAEKAFKINSHGRWMADLNLLAKQRLQHLGVNNIFGGNDCSFENKAHFYSYRRDKSTGRMASLIWIDP